MFARRSPDGAGPIPQMQVQPDPALAELAKTNQALAEVAALVKQLCVIQLAMFDALGRQHGLYVERWRRDFLQALDPMLPGDSSAAMPELIDAVMRRFDAAVKQHRAGGD